MAIFTFGNPNLFVQGIVEQTFYDPQTGDVLGYDMVANDTAINYTFEFSEITGFNATLVGLIPHTTRLTGTYTSAAFSLQQRALLSGGSLHYGAVAPVCETVVASGTTLTVSKTPVHSLSQKASDQYCWCQVREKGAATYNGTNYGVDPATKTVQDFVAESGKSYEVFYFIQNASAQQLNLPTNANPSVVSVHQKWAVYASQNGSRKNGTIQGYLYFIVPLAQLEGDGGMEGGQTANSTTAYNWRAISNKGTMPECDSCDSETDNLGYYIYVPCADTTSEVKALVTIGGGITLKNSETAILPVKYLMPDDTLIQPSWEDLTITGSATHSSASPSGTVTANDSGTGTDTYTVTLTGTDISTTASVTVTA